MHELVALLENTEVLGVLTTSEKVQLASYAVRRVIKRNEFLFWQGDNWANVLFIASGRLRSVIHSLDGRSYVVSTWGKGDEFWATHFLMEGPCHPLWKQFGKA